MSRIRGAVRILKLDKPIFGMIDADGVDYFFIPSLMLSPPDFYFLTKGSIVEFEPFDGPRGMRAAKVRPVLSSTGQDHGQEVSG